jgi:acetolactate synthase-1/2/3 large subunit
LRHAFHEARSGVPGPVFLELPVDILYPEEVVRRFYGVTASEKQRSVFERLRRAHIERHLKRLFSSTAAKKLRGLLTSGPASIHVIDDRMARRAALLLGKAHRPVLLIGSQALLSPDDAAGLVRAVELLGLPVYLSGMARGLLGPDHPLQARHRRKEALREADLVLLAGVPCDFRLEYGRHISRKAKVIAVNRHAADLRKNRQPHLGAHGDPAHFLQGLAPIFSESMASRGGGASGPGEARWQWLETLRRRDRERDEEIKKLARLPAPPINPLRLCEAIDQALAESSIVVADGGDFVATASYIVRPRRPLSWLDPGVFGTLGVGAGFALGAKLCHPEAEVWLLYGDGSAAYSLAEVDTFVRHGMGLIAVVGNDAAWMQIARDQKAVLGDDVGTVLRRSDYHAVAEGWGGRGLLLDDEGRIDEILREAKEIARSGVPVVVNAHLGMTEFRKGSISL